MDVPKGDIEVQTLLAPLPLPFLTTTEHVFGQVTVYTMTALLSSVLEAWRSIPSVPPISEGVIVRAPPHCHYTTVTGWKVELMSLFTYMHYTTTAAQRQPLDHLKQWQKLGWNSVAILILPFQLFARWGIPVFLFFARDVVAWGLYPIVRHCIVFPYIIANASSDGRIKTSRLFQLKKRRILDVHFDSTWIKWSIVLPIATAF